jgi:hypothetical protein
VDKRKNELVNYWIIEWLQKLIKTEHAIFRPSWYLSWCLTWHWRWWFPIPDLQYQVQLLWHESRIKPCYTRLRVYKRHYARSHYIQITNTILASHVAIVSLEKRNKGPVLERMLPTCRQWTQKNSEMNASLKGLKRNSNSNLHYSPMLCNIGFDIQQR